MLKMRLLICLIFKLYSILEDKAFKGQVDIDFFDWDAKTKPIWPKQRSRQIK